MKPRLLIGMCTAVFVATLGLMVGAANDRDQVGPGAWRLPPQAVRGFQLSPVRLDLRGKDPVLVGLGSYFVNAMGGCNDCHTAPPYSKDPYAGLGAPRQVNAACYLAGGTPFGDPSDPQTPVSADITPWEDGKPAGLTFRQFVHVMRTGEDPDNPGHVLQVMPWPVYGNMTDQDLLAVYEYLRAIPAIAANRCGVPSEH